MRPIAGSRAVEDSTSWMPGATIAFAHQNIYLGVDHLRAWRSILASGDTPQFAHVTLLRAATEGATVANWLLRPDRAEERTDRVANYRLEELRLGRELERTIQRRLREEAARGDELAIAALASDEGRLPGAEFYESHLAEMTSRGVTAMRPPTFTSLAEEYGWGAGLYQLMSGIAHRREWAMYELATELGGAEIVGPGVSMKPIQMSTGWALSVTHSTLEAVAGARNSLAEYMGLPLKLHLFVDPTTSLIV
jgi:hypothetical protein